MYIFAEFDKKNLYNYAPDFACKWRDIGIQLLKDKYHNALDVIEADHKGNTEECCKKMIDKWWQTDQKANWSQLIKALKTQSVSLNKLANEIKMVTEGNYFNLQLTCT